jgi:hypothetical protein
MGVDLKLNNFRLFANIYLIKPCGLLFGVHRHHAVEGSGQAFAQGV